MFKRKIKKISIDIITCEPDILLLERIWNKYKSYIIELKVNNNNPEAKSIFENAVDDHISHKYKNDTMFSPDIFSMIHNMIYNYYDIFHSVNNNMNEINVFYYEFLFKRLVAKLYKNMNGRYKPNKKNYKDLFNVNIHIVSKNTEALIYSDNYNSLSFDLIEGCQFTSTSNLSNDRKDVNESWIGNFSLTYGSGKNVSSTVMFLPFKKK